MSANHNCESGGLRLEIELGEIVQHVDGNAGHFEYFGLGQLPSPRTLVDVAAYGGDWGNGRKSFENLRRADIAGMDDVIRTLESFDCRWAQ